MSGSVAAFSRFTLDPLIALDVRLNRLRAFSFVSGIAAPAPAAGAAAIQDAEGERDGPQPAVPPASSAG